MQVMISQNHFRGITKMVLHGRFLLNKVSEPYS